MGAWPNHTELVFHTSHGSNGCWGDVPVAFVVGLTHARPNTPHELVMMGLAVVKSAVSLSKGVGLFSGGDQVAFGRKTGNNRSFFTASGKVAYWSIAHTSRQARNATLTLARENET